MLASQSEVCEPQFQARNQSSCIENTSDYLEKGKVQTASQGGGTGLNPVGAANYG